MGLPYRLKKILFSCSGGLLKHATTLMRGAEVSIKRKYNGEYYQIHVW